MKQIKIGFIGAGKVGVSLGRYFLSRMQLMQAGSTASDVPTSCRQKHAATDRASENSSPGSSLSPSLTITGYFSRTPSSAEEAAVWTGSVCYPDMAALVNDSDAIFLTVPDGQIAGVWQQIRQLPLFGKCICHCSGACSSALFEGIEDTGAFGYSIHPLFAVSSREHSWEELSGAVFAIEGNAEKLSLWEELLKSLGNTVCCISAENKTLYHAAAVMSSNLVIGLFASACALLEQCGFTKEAAPRALAPLFSNNCQNLVKAGAAAALTGPVERADLGTIAGHLEVLPEPQRTAYLALSKLLLPVAGEKHPERSYRELEDLLNKDQ